jgi:hypothetical protein
VEKLISEIGSDAAHQLVARVVPALNQAYAYNGRRYSPENGDDDLFFGVAVWRNATHLLEERCSDLPESEVSERGLGFEIELAGRTFRFYKMPPRLGDNIEAFTMAGSKVRVDQAQSNDDQMKLFETDFADLATVVAEDTAIGGRFPRLVVLHQGTAPDGLRWVAVGAPSAAHGWHWYEKVYDACWAESTIEELAADGFALAPEVALDIRVKPEVLGQAQNRITT